jgi:hypothetical protein
MVDVTPFFSGISLHKSYPCRTIDIGLVQRSIDGVVGGTTMFVLQVVFQSLQRQWIQGRCLEACDIQDFFNPAAPGRTGNVRHFFFYKTFAVAL